MCALRKKASVLLSVAVGTWCVPAVADPGDAAMGPATEAGATLERTFESPPDARAEPSLTGDPDELPVRKRPYTLYLTPGEALLAFLALTKAAGMKPLAEGRKSMAASPPRGRALPIGAGSETVSAVLVGARTRTAAEAGRTSGNPAPGRREMRQQVYPGVELVYDGESHPPEFSFVVSPGTDPACIRLKMTGTDRLELTGSGALLVHAGRQLIRLPRPLVYQFFDGVKNEIPASYRLDEDDFVGFSLGLYSPGVPLIIEPEFDESTYLDRGSEASNLNIAVETGAAGSRR